MKKSFRFVAISLLFLIVIALSYVAIYFPGVMTGMDAKVMCSCVFVAGRTPESVLAKELRVFPGLTWAKINVDKEDSTVIASLLWRSSKAIFRNGLGCTLLSQRTEQEVRKQRIQLLDVPVVDPDSIDWPSGDRMHRNGNASGVDIKLLKEAIDSAFYDRDPSKPVHTHAVVIIYDGTLLAERYADGFDKNSRMMGWSMTKSINNGLVGIMLKEKNLTVNDYVAIPEWQSDDRKNITFENLLHASSGLEWNESYFVPTSHFHQMFIREDDKGGYAASLDLDSPPATVFQYSSGSSNILSKIIRQQVGDSSYYRFPYEKLFHRIGMYSAIIEPDASGTFVASSYSFATARDWARLGLLYLNKGVWQGQQVLPKGWVEYSITPAPAAKMREYGAHIWLNRGDPSDSTKCLLPGIPNDAYLFEGFERNSVTVVPSKKLVVVRLGVTHNGNFNLPKLIRGVINALPDVSQ